MESNEIIETTGEVVETVSKMDMSGLKNAGKIGGLIALGGALGAFTVKVIIPKGKEFFAAAHEKHEQKKQAKAEAKKNKAEVQVK